VGVEQNFPLREKEIYNNECLKLRGSCKGISHRGLTWFRPLSF